MSEYEASGFAERVPADEIAYRQVAGVDLPPTEIQSLVEQIQQSIATLESTMTAHQDSVGDLEGRIQPILASPAVEPGMEEKEGSRPEPVIETELGHALYAIKGRILALSAIERRRAVDTQDVTGRIRL